MGGHRVIATNGGDGGETQAIVFAVVRDEEHTHAARGLTPAQQQWLVQSIMPVLGDAIYAGEISPAEADRMVGEYESSAA